MSRLVRFLALALAIGTTGAHSAAQHRLRPAASLGGAPGLELALRKLDTVGSFMMATAHPDDENNGMLAYFAHGKGYRATLVTATHGEGGQNEIGPELFEALAVLRTEELSAAHRFDGAEQFFTRAIDFGYSFSIEETLEKWGHQEILGDFVRMIRTIRPDVIVGFIFSGEGGGQHHQTSTRLALEAFRAAADAARFPEQIAEGLRPWQAAKFYYTAGFGGPGAGRPGGASGAAAGAAGTMVEAPSTLAFTGGDEFDRVLGRTYNEIGAEARSMHKCQGMSQLLPLPAGGGGPMGPGGARAYRLRDTVLDGGVARPEREVFDGVDTSLRGLLRFAPGAPAGLGQALDRIGASVAEARTALAASGTGATVAPLARGLTALRDLRAQLASLVPDERARYEIEFRLAPKEQQFAEALLLSTDLRVDAVARDGLVVPGQRVRVDAMAANRGSLPVELAVTIDGFGAPIAACESPAEVAPGASRACSTTPAVPADARLTAAHFRTGTEGARYVLDPDVPFGLPFRPTPFVATFSLKVGDTAFAIARPVQARSEADLFSGEKRAEIHVVPAFAVSTTPETLIVPARPNPADARSASRDVRVTVVNHAAGPASADVSLEVPSGWRATPAAQPVSFSREDEATTVRFALHAPPPATLAQAAMTPGGNRFVVRAMIRPSTRASDPGARSGPEPAALAQGYRLVEYPHTTRRHVLASPQVTVKALDVGVAPGLSVGYVMGVGDAVPQALDQLGVTLTTIGADELAWGDLSKYDVIVTGVRAYERGPLRAYNDRLIDFARGGGTVIVQYNKFEFNDAQYGPYPGRVGRERVTDENAEVRLTDPRHPVFTTPNAIGRADWTGWVQERGLYFFDTTGRDPHYQDLVEFTEPFPYNQGAKLGALVEARVGQGRWLYVGLGLWRQLPAGTDGAYRLMANLLSLGRAPGVKSTPSPRQR